MLYSPMLSLERVKHGQVLGPVRNKHLVAISSAISWLSPTLPVAKSAEFRGRPAGDQGVSRGPALVGAMPPV